MADSPATTALDAQRAYFNERDHRPSAAHWDALAAIAETMEAMAAGTCPAKVFLSAVDCGIGKTSTVLHTTRALLASPDHRHVGMLVCVGRIAEAEAFAMALSDYRDRIAVLTSDDTANALSGAVPSNAQVLVTTQQRIERATEGRSFEGAEAFHYQGAARAVRVWDEAWLPGVTVTLDADDLFGLLKPARSVSDALAEALFTFAATLRGLPDDALVDVPNFDAGDGALYEVMASVAAGSLREDQRLAATALLAMNGKAARVQRDGKQGPTILTYRNTLPADLLPLLVLDASGRVRQTYSDVEEHRKTLQRLPSAVKDYSPLTVATWKVAGSKHGFATNGAHLAEGIARTILTRPDEEWLAVVHKPGGRIKNVEAAIRRSLPRDVGDRLKVITWGAHMATNAFADVPNVILAGTLFYRPSFYTALTHLAQDRGVATGSASKEAVEQTMRGEHANLVLQALCRGRVRKSDGERCHEMRAYIIASPRSGIPLGLSDIFPGCTVVNWTPFAPVLSGKLKEAVEYVEAAIRKGIVRLSFRGIQGAIEVRANNFRREVTSRPEWATMLDTVGLETTGGAVRATGIRLKGAA